MIHFGKIMQIGRSKVPISRHYKDRMHALRFLAPQLALPQIPDAKLSFEIRGRFGFSQAIASELMLVSLRTYQRFEEGAVAIHPWAWLIYKHLARAYWHASDPKVRGSPVEVELAGPQFLDWTEEKSDVRLDISGSGCVGEAEAEHSRAGGTGAASDSGESV